MEEEGEAIPASLISVESTSSFESLRTESASSSSLLLLFALLSLLFFSPNPDGEEEKSETAGLSW